jgi:hypothetical protein
VLGSYENSSRKNTRIAQANLAPCGASVSIKYYVIGALASALPEQYPEGNTDGRYHDKTRGLAGRATVPPAAPKRRSHRVDHETPQQKHLLIAWRAALTSSTFPGQRRWHARRYTSVS